MIKYLEKHPLLVLVVGILGISASAIFVRYSVAPSTLTAATRLICTVVMLTPAVMLNKAVRAELKALPKRTLLLCAASGSFLAAHFSLWFESLAYTSVASSTAIVCTEVIWVALGYCLLMKGRLSAKAIGCICLALGGSVLIAFADSAAGGGHLYGDLLSLAGAVAVAAYTLIGRSVRATTSNTVYTYVVYLVCAAELTAVVLLQGYRFTGYGANPWIVGFLLGLFSTVFGHSVFSWCLKYLSPAFVSASKLCEPVVAAALAALLFREVPRPMQLLGGLIVLGGVLAYSRLEQTQSEKETKA